MTDPVRAIADAVLYEGYVLWPYRRTALKNQRRFTFGGVYPAAWSAEHPDDACAMQTEVLVREEARLSVSVTVRFLHIVSRTVLVDGRPVDAVEVDGERLVSWEEAVEREVMVGGLDGEALRAGRSVGIDVSAGCEREAVRDRGDVVGAEIERRWPAVCGTVRVSARDAEPGVLAVVVRIENTTPLAGSTRGDALRLAMCSTHTLLSVDGGAFVSMTDPPAHLADAVGACTNIGTWPVLVGPPGDTSTILSSPIILEDHPQIAAQSPGDLFDGGEIDELLILNILALSDEEKAEMAAADPRTREILRRSEGLTPDQLMALHGSVREVGLRR